MMKYILTAALFCLCFTDMVYSSTCDKGEHCCELRCDYGDEYLCHEFGFNNIITVYVTNGDSICNVSILDGKGNCDETTCPKSPILEWAFGDMTNEFAKASVKEDNIYKSHYYKLSIFKGCNQTILSSTTLQIDYADDDVKKKIEDLRAFMVRLWQTSFIKRLEAQKIQEKSLSK